MHSYARLMQSISRFLTGKIENATRFHSPVTIKEHTLALQQVSLLVDFAPIRLPLKPPERPVARHHAMTRDHWCIRVTPQRLSHGLTAAAVNELRQKPVRGHATIRYATERRVDCFLERSDPGPGGGSFVVTTTPRQQ